MSAEDYTLTQTPDFNESTLIIDEHEYASEEQGRLANFMSGVSERIHDIAGAARARRNHAGAVLGLTAAVGGGLTLANEAFANSSASETQATQRTFSGVDATKKVERMVKKCGGNDKVTVINIQPGSTKTRKSKGVIGNSHIENNHADFNWKYKKGYKLCGLVAGYNFMYVSNYTQFPKPSLNTAKFGSLHEKTPVGDKSISQLDVIATKIKR